MDDLLHRAQRFQEEGYAQRAELYRRLDGGQQPHTLVIACADSRVDPALLTGAEPGELFVVRNVANVVPPWVAGDDRAHERSAIEFAVLVLGVRRIVVLGHSRCAGCAALADPSSISEQLPNLRSWVAATGARSEPTAEAVERAHVRQQLANLRTYPFVAKLEADGSLKPSGWHHRIATGEVLEIE